MPAPSKAPAPGAREHSDLPLGRPIGTLERPESPGEQDRPKGYRVSLPWEDFAEAWSRAENQLACLEHDLAPNDLRPYWICRGDFEEAAALAALHGEDVAMEDLVLADAGAAPRKQTAAWAMAKALLSLRRHISRAGPAQVLTVDGILELEIRLASALTAAGTVATPASAPESRRQRVARWLSVVDDLQATPPLPAAAIALRVWRRIAPLTTYNDEIGLILSSVLLWHWGKTKGLTACPAAGLRAAGLAAVSRDLDDRATLGDWIALFCGAVEASAAAGQERLRSLTLGRARAAELLRRHRTNSRLPRLISLFLTYPVMTVRFINHRLEITTQGVEWLLKELVSDGMVIEATGRAKNRAFRLS